MVGFDFSDFSSILFHFFDFEDLLSYHLLLGVLITERLCSGWARIVGLLVLVLVAQRLDCDLHHLGSPLGTTDTQGGVCMNAVNTSLLWSSSEARNASYSSSFSTQVVADWVCKPRFENSVNMEWSRNHRSSKDGIGGLCPLPLKQRSR